MSATTGEDWPTSGTRESDRPRHRATQRCLDRGSAAAERGEGKGIGGNHKRIDSGRRTTKVSRALERSGDPKVYARDHGGSANKLGRACDRRRVPFVRFERKGAGTGRAPIDPL